MKKIIFASFVALCTVNVCAAMSEGMARREAAFLTDKMEYELGLTPTQAEDVYYINLDYLLSLDDVRLTYVSERAYRDEALRAVLTLHQWNRYVGLAYFVRPVYVWHNAWRFHIYDRYARTRYYSRIHFASLPMRHHVAPHRPVGPAVHHASHHVPAPRHDARHAVSQHRTSVTHHAGNVQRGNAAHASNVHQGHGTHPSSGMRQGGGTRHDGGMRQSSRGHDKGGRNATSSRRR